MKKILVIEANPSDKSLNCALASAYEKGAAGAAEVERVNIRDLKFDPNLRFGYKEDMPLEEDLRAALEKIQKADHLVFVHPLWWGSYPAMMKGFIDRIFLPKIAFDHDKNGNRIKLFSGKTARIIVTMEQPNWFYRFVLLSPSIRQLKSVTLEFCGVKNIKSTCFGSVGSANAAQIEKWLRKCENMGREEARQK